MSEAEKERPIRSISDTARWVAVYRAMETERPDAIFRDPYARRLAGERGEQIVRALRGGLRNSWSMIVRTAVFDELILQVLSRDSTDLVINLAAGLDTRPYRLSLPASLRWAEVDLPEMIAYKGEALAGETPRCRLERVVLNLADEPARQKLFGKWEASASHVLVLTEGLLAYLTPGQVATLARDLYACEHFRYWIAEVASPKVKQRMERYWGKQLRAANAPIQFAPAEGEEFFRPHGWEAAEFREFLHESRRLNRPMPMDAMIRFQEKLFPRFMAKQLKKWRSGAALLRRI